MGVGYRGKFAVKAFKTVHGVEIDSFAAPVMAAYNGGMARISGELDKQDADTSLDLYLVEETTRYPYRIMASMRGDSRYFPRMRDKGGPEARCSLSVVWKAPGNIGWRV